MFYLVFLIIFVFGMFYIAIPNLNIDKYFKYNSFLKQNCYLDRSCWVKNDDIITIAPPETKRNKYCLGDRYKKIDLPSLFYVDKFYGFFSG